MGEIQEIIAWGLEIAKVLGMYGPLGMSSLFLMLAIRFYQTDSLQQMLPKRVRWSSLSPLAKILLPVGGSLLAALLAILGGASAPLVLPLAAACAGGAILGHHGTKALGGMLYNREVKKDAFYEPSPMREKMSIIVPLPKLKDVLLNKAP